MQMEFESSHHEFDTEEALPRGVDISFAGFQPLQENESFVLPEAPQGLLVLAATQGSGEISFESARSIHAQDAILLKLPARITARSSPDSTLAIFYAVLLERIGLTDHLPALNEPFDGAPVLERLNDFVLHAQGGRSRFQRAAYGFGLLMACCEALDNGVSEAYPPLVSNALGIIEEEYPYIFGVAEIAESLEVSKHHLIREFTRALGVSPGKKLAQTRIRHAKKLLLEREYTVEIVGQMVGYANGNYFCKVFREHTGMSPKEYMNKR